jgi:hypothetical protein
MVVVQIAKRAERMSDLVGPAGSQRNLNALAGLYDEVPKFAVEGIQIPKLFEGGSGKKAVAIARMREWKSIGGNPVVVMMFQAMQGEVLVSHHQPTRFEELELLKIGFRGLAHGFGIVPHGIPAEKKKPLLVRIVERRERCCWEKGARLLQPGKLEFRKGGTFFIA